MLLKASYRQSTIRKINSKQLDVSDLKTISNHYYEAGKWLTTCIL